MSIKRILFCEPATNAVYHIHSNNGNNIVDLTPSEFKLLTLTPTELFNSEDRNWIKSNAYLFGPVFNIDSYTTVAIHDNDVSQTGIIDVTNITGPELKTINTYDLWVNAYELDSQDRYVSWGSTQHLRHARRTISDRIMFVGDTEGGDVGAKMLVHRTSGAIDSFIIMSHARDDKIELYDQMEFDWSLLFFF